VRKRIRSTTVMDVLKEKMNYVSTLKNVKSWFDPLKLWTTIKLIYFCTSAKLANGVNAALKNTL
jgi:hypothetical protein